MLRLRTRQTCSYLPQTGNLSERRFGPGLDRKYLIAAAELGEASSPIHRVAAANRSTCCGLCQSCFGVRWSDAPACLACSNQHEPCEKQGRYGL